MANVHDILEAQRARLATVDAAIPDEFPLPRGEPLMARTSHGIVAGLLTHTTVSPESPQSLWSALETHELFPLLGEYPQAGMDALLRAWRARLVEQNVSSTDSACVVTWPSRDVHATRVLLDHGFVPLSCLAIRPSLSNLERHPPPEHVSLRKARPSDLDDVVALSLAELEYASFVGASTLRPAAWEIKRTALRERLRFATAAADAPVWLAERGGETVALAESGWVDVTAHSGHRIQPGRWGYVNCVAVRESRRGSGVGSSLMDAVHADIIAGGARGSFLYYNQANPLSSVFWPRQGYRPLWTIWEVRPATALR